MFVPLIILLLFLLVASFWLSRVLSPDNRVAERFFYDSNDNPTRLNGILPRDDAPTHYAGDPPAEQWPAVTIICPGRNEGHVLESTLGSLCRVDYSAGKLRIIFVDDQSTDNTPEVCATLTARYPHLTILRTQADPPAGWVGKIWAIHQADAYIQAPQEPGDYLLFVDSDLCFHPACLQQMIRLARHRNTDLLSLLPFIDCPTLGEKLGILMGLQLIALKYPLRQSNNPRSPICLVAGGFLLFKRASYLALGATAAGAEGGRGGHAAIRGQMVEDIALGTMAKNRGLRVYTVGTHALLTGRMYEGWADTFRGLKKNSYAGANYQLPLAVLAILLLTILFVAMPLYPLVGLGWWILHPGYYSFSLLVLGVGAWACMLWAARRAGNLLKFPAYLAWLTPLAAAFFLLIFGASILEHHRGGNQWSGRRYRKEHVSALNELPPRDTM